MRHSKGGGLVIGQVNSSIVENDDVDFWPLGLEADLSDLDSAQQNAVKKFVSQHCKVFACGDELGYTDLIKHTIPTTDDRPVRLPHRRILPNLQPEVKEHLQKWVKQGVIEPSKSSYASQAVLVRKKCGGLRICMDYRLLNSRTRKDAYPLPRIDESLEALKGARFISSLDLIQGYLQCAMDESDAHKTAFRVGTGGLYQFNRMPFGLCNSQSTFQRLMDTCFGDQVFEILLLFLDDILVYASTVEEMIERLDLFTRLENYGLKLKPQKCFLFKRLICYLGHVVSADGIATDPDKINISSDPGIP